MTMQQFEQFLKNLQSGAGYEGQIAYTAEIPERPARYADFEEPLPPALARGLAGLGVQHFYTHQTAAVDAVRAGNDVVVVTNTASGKTLCYTIPIIEALLQEKSAAALCLFPTKALAQDQLRGLVRLAEAETEIAANLTAGTYDGDTSSHHKRKLRTSANVILSNPDMLHAGILPYHTRWARFFQNLKYIIIDEIHTYRGIFGSNVACVLRRLERICNHYGAHPQFICSSATIANPKELATRLTGRDMQVIDDDGSPSGRKLFVFWNPPYIDKMKMERRSTNVEAQRLLVQLIRRRSQTIAFTKARVVAELIYRYSREELAEISKDLATSIRPYRGGYLPEERRDIEKKLFSGDLLGVVSTNALELGIDVGRLDSCIIVGYPGTIASTWQQAGRAGRSRNESIAILVAYDDPIDQYLMRHPGYFFGKSPEHAIIDPQNPYILYGHLGCAAAEKPLTLDDARSFGGQSAAVIDLLESTRSLKKIDDRWYWSQPEAPSRSVNLRTISDDTFTIVEETSEGRRAVGQVDSISAPELVYPEAIYLHEGESYLVKSLDLEAKVALIKRTDADYYTQPILTQSLTIDELAMQKQWMDVDVHFGDVTVTWATVMFGKFKFYTGENIGYKKLDLPPQNLETSAVWIKLPITATQTVSAAGYKLIEGMAGLKNLLMVALPVVAMCDPRDIGGNIEFDREDARLSIFLYDRFRGGIGFAERGYESINSLLTMAWQMLNECECAEGCPSCVGMPNLRPPIHQDPDRGGGWPIPSKEAARILLKEILGGIIFE